MGREALISTFEIAKKQRHLYLLQKVKDNKSLTASELKELKEYEGRDSKTSDKIIAVKKKGRGRKTKNKRRLGAVRIKALALTCDTFTEAEDQTEENLTKLFETKPKLKTAWERGRFLRNLQKLASAALTVNEAENALGMQRDKLTEMFEADKEVADIWNQSKLETLIAVKTAIVTAAKEGKHLAASQVETILRSEFAASKQKDYHKISINQLTELTGKTRRTISNWVGKHGLPRNSNKTFDLAVFINWFEKYTVEKLPAKTLLAANPLQELKAERLEMDLARQKNHLLNREEVIAGLIARHQNLINSLSHKAEEIAILCNGQPQVKITEILNNFFDEVLRQQCQVPEQLRLPAAQADKFEELLKILRPEGQ